MKTFLLAILVLLSFGVTSGFAGGRPRMFVVVDRVETTQDHESISMIRIWGSFIRVENNTNNYTKPVSGYMQFGSGSDKEAAKWKKAAGTGKAVVVGFCAGAGAFETGPIHRPDEKPKDHGDDLPYPAGHIELFGPNGLDPKTGDLFGSGRFNDDPDVKNLLAFATNMSVIRNVPRKPDGETVDNTWVGSWTIEFANGVVETCDLAKEGKVFVSEPNRRSFGKVNQSFKEGLLLFFDDGRVERWTKVNQRIVVEHWATFDLYQDYNQRPYMGIGEKMK